MLVKACSAILERFKPCFRALPTTFLLKYRLTVVFVAVLLWCFPRGICSSVRAHFKAN